MDASQQALLLLHDLGDRPGEMLCWNTLGNVHVQQGRLEKAAVCYQKALDVAEELGSRSGLSQAQGNLGVIYQQQGRYAEAESAYRESLRLCQAMGDRQGEAQTLNNIGLLLLESGRFQDGAADLEQSLAIYQELGDRPGQQETLSNLGVAHRHLGQMTAALRYYQQALEIAEALADRGSQADTLLNICFLLHAQENPAAVGPLAERAWHLAEATGAYDVLARLCWLAGDLEIERGDYEAAGGAYAHALRYAEPFSAERVRDTVQRQNARTAEIRSAVGDEAAERFASAYHGLTDD